MLTRTAAELTAEYGVQFLRDVADGLGPYSYAALDGGRVGQLWLVAYDDDPEPGTEVWADISVALDEALDALWRTARWDIRAFSWVNPYPAHPGSWPVRSVVGVPSRPLTPREAEVGRLLLEGGDTRSIAAGMRISVSAVRKHVALLRLKFGVTSTEDLRSRLESFRVQPPAAGLRHSA